MNTFNKFMIATACGLLTVGAASAIALSFGDTDYERIPPDPDEVHAQIDQFETTLADAVSIAEKAVDGLAQSAEFNLTAARPTIDVVLYTESAQWNVRVNASDGSIFSRNQKPPFEFPGWQFEGELTETESGLRYFDVEVGEGAPADPGKTVTVHYTGWLVDGKKFDSSVDRGQPATFPLSRVIPGWTEGVGSMREGGKRKLVIPYQLAYGVNGRPPQIPPRAMLIFDVELISVQE